MPDNRWARSDLHLMVLLSIAFLKTTAYGSALRNAFQQINHMDREVPSVYGYLHRAVAEGHAIRTAGREGAYNVVRYRLTPEGEKFLSHRWTQLVDASHLPKEVLSEVGIQPKGKSRKTS